MMKGKRIVAVLLGMGLLFGSFQKAEALGFRRPAAPLGGEVLNMLAEVDLSEEQQREVAEVIASVRGKNRAMIKDIIKARANLFKTIHADPYDEADIREAHRGVARIEEEFAVRRAVVAAELKAVLTPEQRERVSEAKGGLFERIRKRVDFVFSLVDCWVFGKTGR